MLLVLPTLLVVFLVIGVPLIYSLALSLHRINPLTQRWIFVGLANYAKVLPDPDFIAAFGRTAYFAVITVIGGLVLGMAMALVLNMAFVGRDVLRSLVLVPWAMSPVAVGILWSWMLNGDYGTFNAILLSLGVITAPIHWLGNGAVAMNLVAIAHVWNQAPLTSLLILAGLQSMPENLHRAARIDGAGAVRRFFSITLPWLRPMLLLVLILTSINSIMAFDLFWTMTHGGPGSATTVFSWMGYAYAFQFFRFGEGAAILYVLTIVCLILAWFYLKLFFHSAPRGRKRAGRETDVGSDASLPLGAATPSTGFSSTLANIPMVPARAWLSGRTRRTVAGLGLAVAALLIFVWSFGPFFFLVLMSLSPSSDLVRSPPLLVPNSLTLANYAYLIAPQGVSGGQSAVEATRVVSSIWNSLIVAVCVTAVNLALGSFAAYAFSRNRESRFLTSSLWALMMTRMTPSLALILPFFIVFKTLRSLGHAHRARDCLLQPDPAALHLDDERLFRWHAAQSRTGRARRRLHALPNDPQDRAPGRAAGLGGGGYILLPGELERVHFRADPDQHAGLQDHPGDHRRVSGAAPLLRLWTDVRGERDGGAAARGDHARLPALPGARHALRLAERLGTFGWRA